MTKDTDVFLHLGYLQAVRKKLAIARKLIQEASDPIAESIYENRSEVGEISRACVAEAIKHAKECIAILEKL